MNDKKGVAPPDVNTDIGTMRFALGDYEYTELDPPVPGFGEYVFYSDDALQAFLNIAGGSVSRALATAYRNIGAHWASMSATIKTDDLNLSARDSVGNWLALAKQWDDLADREDAKAVNDFLAIVPVGGRRQIKPEGLPYIPPTCRGSRW